MKLLRNLCLMLLACSLFFVSCKKTEAPDNNGNNNENPVEQPAGVYVTFGSEQWTAGEFMVDADVYASYDKLLFYVFKTTSQAQFPQFQGYMPNIVGVSALADNDRLLYVGSADELDAQGNVEWMATSLRTEITAIDLATYTITAVQTGEMKNQRTSETKDVKIQYNNVTWIPTSIQTK